MESSGYSSKTLQKGACLYAPLDKILRYRGKIVFSDDDDYYYDNHDDDELMMMMVMVVMN